MTGKKFFTHLGLTILISVVLFILMRLVWPIGTYTDLAGITILFFTLLCLFLYTVLTKLNVVVGGRSFISMVMFNVFFKLLGSFALIYIYVQLKSPVDKLFLIPFLAIYLCFMVFETYFLTQVAKRN